MPLPRAFAFLALVIALVVSGVVATIAQVAPDTVVDGSGNLRVPTDYRSHYEFLGSWSVAADNADEGAQAIHQVYASPGAIAAYRRDGDFPDGTVLVKEVWSTATDSMTTGLVSRAETMSGWFVMVRDSRGSHIGSKLWGEGWGWSWFDADQPGKTTSTDFATDCQACHEPASKSHWIYAEGYPALRR